MVKSFVSETGIANMALSHVGARSDIESLDEDSAEAIQCNLWYNYARQGVLEAYNWKFARKRITLALHGDTISTTEGDPLTGVWGFRYQYPDDCLVARKIQNPFSPPADAIPYEVETSLTGEELSILTNKEDAVLVYTFDQTSTPLFSRLFVLAFSRLLASHIAFSLTSKTAIATDQFNFYQGLVTGASASDGNEQVSPPPRDAAAIRARTATGGVGVGGDPTDTLADASN